VFCPAQPLWRVSSVEGTIRTRTSAPHTRNHTRTDVPVRSMDACTHARRHTCGHLLQRQVTPAHIVGAEGDEKSLGAQVPNP
jgi:hypothetical protein